ncbi:sensor histidine kinase [Massilia sp. LXY-6]|uniref:sensor histidine kinase n=1 Tax=Massilia sp. LXY-6 TaxID=3379823 RepID=UPI003EE3A959
MKNLLYWSVASISAPIRARYHLARPALLRWLLRQEQQQEHALVRLHFLAWVGCIGMPLYYFVWTAWFPQKFESLDLRMLGFVLCLPALLFPRKIKGNWLRVYEFTSVTYVMPFFFSYMFLMNHGSAVWGESLLLALILLFQFDSLWALASCTAGALLACIVYAVGGDPNAGADGFRAFPLALEQAPIYVFTIVIVALTKVGRRVVAREKLAGMAQALGMVSHELRTPLISISANVRGIERAASGWEAGVPGALARIRFEVRHMNQMIDLFLLSAAAMNQQMAPTERVWMSEMVHAVIERYPFVTEEQRLQVNVVVRSDFAFLGRQELGAVVLLNLLRNALKALQRAGKGKVRIIIDGARKRPRLLLMDSGCGIPARQLPYIFERFYSYPAHTGSGIGLALCKDIVHAWHGKIRCRSREHVYTVFSLEFPPARRAADVPPAPPSPRALDDRGFP